MSRRYAVQQRSFVVPVALFALLTGLSACQDPVTATNGTTDLTSARYPRATPALVEASGVKSQAAKRCQKGGWTQVRRADLTAFVSEGDCISYLATGGKLFQYITFDRRTGYAKFGETYTPQATASSGLFVTLALDVASTGCSFTNGVASFTEPGTCLINATQAGDETWAPAQAQHSTIVVVIPAVHCAAIGGTYGGATATELWSCTGYTATSLEDDLAKRFPLADACVADRGFSQTSFFPGFSYPNTQNTLCKPLPS